MLNYSETTKNLFSVCILNSSLDCCYKQPHPYEKGTSKKSSNLFVRNRQVLERILLVRFRFYLHRNQQTFKRIETKQSIT